MSNYKARFSIDWARWLLGATFWGANGFDLFLGPIRFRLSPGYYVMEDHNLALKKAISYSLKNDWKNHD